MRRPLVNGHDRAVARRGGRHGPCPPPMFVLLLLLAGLCFCWLVYKGAVYALPFVIGWSLGKIAYQLGSGFPVALLFGCGAAIAVFTLARAAYAAIPIHAFRWLLALVFVTPTLVMAYNVALDLLSGSTPSPLWRHGASGAIALLAGSVALRRLAGES